RGQAQALELVGAHPAAQRFFGTELEPQCLGADARAHQPGVAGARQVAAFAECGARRAAGVARADAPELGPDLLPRGAPLRAASSRTEIAAQEAESLAASDSKVAPVELRELRPGAVTEWSAAQARALEVDQHEGAVVAQQEVVRREVVLVDAQVVELAREG